MACLRRSPRSMGSSVRSAGEVTELAEELAAACRALEDGLAPLEQQACLVSTPTWTAM